MPKRKRDEEKLKYYENKIRRLVRRQRRRRDKTPSSAESDFKLEYLDRNLSPVHWDIESEKDIRLEESSPEHETPSLSVTGEEIDYGQEPSLHSVVVPVLNEDLSVPAENTPKNPVSTSKVPEASSKVPEASVIQENVTSEPPLDEEILKALGDPIQDKPKYGPPIKGDLALRWTAIAKGGLDREAKEKLFKAHLIPENCPYFQAPKLNPEIVASISDTIKNRDKKIESEQQQLGHGITALSKGLSLLITSPSDKITIIKLLSDASKILTDLHHCETVGRRKLITPLLDKKFIDIAKDIERDDFLYGQDLSEKIKSMKNVLRSGQSIKKIDKVGGNNFRKPGGNYSGPPRTQAAKPSYRSGPSRPTMGPNNRSYKAPPQPMRKKPDPKPPARK